MPTLQPAAAADAPVLAAALAASLGAAALAAALGALLEPLLEQAAKTNMALARTAPTFLLNIFGNYLLRSSRTTASNWTMVVPRQATTLLRTKRNPPGGSSTMQGFGPALA